MLRADVKSTRLTCRELCAAADYVFIQTFFTSRKHLLTAHSLRTLVEISKIPRLRQKIRHVKFIHMHPDQYIIKSPHDCSVVGAKWRTIFRETEAIAIDLIREVLQNIKELGISPSIAIDKPPALFHLPDPEVTCHGARLFLGDLERVAPCEEIYFQQDTYKASNDVEVYWLLSSIIAAKFAVQNLNLCLGAPQQFEKCSPGLESESSIALGMCCSSLTSLVLRFDPDATWKLVGVYNTLHAALANSTALKKVSLGLEYGPTGWETHEGFWDDSALFRGILTNSRNIESLTLFDCQVSQTNLHQLLGSSAKALKELRLDGVAIEPEAKWKDTLLWITEECEQLEQLVAITLFQGLYELEEEKRIVGNIGMAQQIRCFAEEAVFS